MVEAEIDRYTALSIAFEQQVSSILDLSRGQAESVSRKVWLSHPKGVGLPDCLERTIWHINLDRNPPRKLSLESLDWSSQSHIQLINQQDILGRMRLHIACMRGWEPTVEMLLLHGADPRAETLLGSTPLHFAVALGHHKICARLLQTVASNGVSIKDHQDC
jgi:hypothetical protein